MSQHSVVLDLNEFAGETAKIIIKKKGFIIPAAPRMEIFLKLSNISSKTSSEQREILISIVKQILETREKKIYFWFFKRSNKLSKKENEMVEELNDLQLAKIANTYISKAQEIFLAGGAEQKKTKSPEQ